MDGDYPFPLAHSVLPLLIAGRPSLLGDAAAWSWSAMQPRGISGRSGSTQPVVAGWQLLPTLSALRRRPTISESQGFNMAGWIAPRPLRCRVDKLLRHPPLFWPTPPAWR